MPARPPTAFRAGLAAAVAVLVAAAAHAAAGGAVDLAGAGWTFAALTAPAWWLNRRERGWTVLAVAQLAAQQVAHVVLAGPGHPHGLLPMDLMLHVHLLAAALSAVGLRLGERRAWAASRAVVHTCLLLVTSPAPVSAPPAPRSADPIVAPATALLQHVVARRGPPHPAV